MNKYLNQQKNMPYISSISQYVKEKRIPFHMPGHKGGKGINSELIKLWGNKVFKYDLTEVDGLDYLNAPSGVIMKAEKLAAQAFGVKNTFFLINGSTVGNQAAILSLVKKGEKIIVPRNSHQSVFSSLILSGAYPIYINPTYDPQTSLYQAISSKSIKLAIEKNSDVKAIHITSPNYNGFISNVKAISNLAKKKNIPLIVDEAHGAHFKFHSELPTSAIDYDTDIVIHSTHKTLGSVTQTSMLHLIKYTHVSASQLQHCLMLLQSSSPSTLFIMSLDAARQQMVTKGYALMDKTLWLARYARNKINYLKHFYCYGKEVIGQSDIIDIDETKLLIDVAKTGLTGYEFEKILGRDYQIEIEMSDLKHILCFITIGDTKYSINKLVFALKKISNNPKRVKPKLMVSALPDMPKIVLSPRDAFFSNKKLIPFSQTLGEISGEFIIPFPPDVPIIVPGERINKEIFDYVKYMKRNGMMVIGPKDLSLKMIEVIK